MRKFLIISALLVISACTKPTTPTPPAVENIPTPPPVTEQKPTETMPKPEAMPKNAIVTLNYTLRDGAANGKIIESTIESVSRENGVYQSGMSFEPFRLVLGTNSVIPGFEAGVASMKKGEKKMIEVAAKDGYGETSIVRTVPKYEVAPEFTITVDKARFQDVITQVVPLSSLGDAGKGLKEWQTLTGGLGIPAKVVKLDGENVTLAIENRDHPFYGKKLEVGASSEVDGAKFTVKQLTETGVTMDVVNSRSPFAGKKFEVGIEGVLQNPATTTTVPLKIAAINGENIDVLMPNPHPLAGKTLFFDVEVLDIE
jgi:FKBP-type peptidyl-prolyl cis-trans isomerase 2